MARHIFTDPKVVGNPYKHYIVFSIYMYLFWLLITQTLHLKFLIMGAVSALLVARICMPLFLIRNLTQTKKYFVFDVNLLQFGLYTLWLMKELVLANLDVVKAVWHKDMPIEPQVVTFTTRFDNPIAVSLLANSITLTPGTVTLQVNRSNTFEIHALTPAAARGIRDGAMLKKVAALFHEDDYFEIVEEVPKS